MTNRGSNSLLDWVRNGFFVFSRGTRFLWIGILVWVKGQSPDSMLTYDNEREGEGYKSTRGYSHLWSLTNDKTRADKVLKNFFPCIKETTVCLVAAALLGCPCVHTRPKNCYSDHEWNISSYEKVVQCANDRTTSILIMIEASSRGSFDHAKTKHVKNGGLMRGRRVLKRSPMSCPAL